MFLTKMRIALAVLAIAACLFVMQAAARVGFSRLLAKYALIANSIPAADEAIRLSPSDPDTHRARATVSNRLRMPAEVSKSLESALTQRYRDDYLWIELGSAREELGDAQGALAAFDQAVRWAPYYAHTHWQRGNLLLRMGRFTEAFVELRKAADANKNYFPNLIDLAWSMSRDTGRTIEQLIEIKNDSDRLALIRFLARKGQGKDIPDQIRLLDVPIASEQIDELARLLSEARAFSDAYKVWGETQPTRLQSGLYNGGFEEPMVIKQVGFGGWSLYPETSGELSIDVSEKLAGERSLRINLAGNWTPGLKLLSQSFIVEPSKTYRIFFSVKTKDLVTGGPPIFAVTDAGTRELLGKSETFPSSDAWQTLNFEFTTLATTEAVVIGLQRNNCEPAPCPIFGVLWLDEIRVERTSQPQSTKLN